MNNSEHSVEATVIVPTMRDRGVLLPLSVGSVLAQTVSNIEVFIVGDGVDEETRLIIQELMRGDARIKFFDHPKHERRGEPNRHAALTEARGRIVCYLTDRDLMLPNHVAQMQVLLQQADFAHTLLSAITPKGQFSFLKSIDLSDLADREWILRGWARENGIPFSFAGHTLEFYRQLPHGWRVTPPNHFTDIYMWEQFLAQPDCRTKSGTVPTVLYFPKRWRKEWSTEDRLAELREWQERMTGPDREERIMQMVIDGLAANQVMRGRQLRQIGLGLQSFADHYTEIMRRGR